MSPRARDFLTLTKPRITALVLATTAMGYFLAGGARPWRLAWALLGAGLCSAACGALNQWMETEPDGRMYRTRARPLPSGRLLPREALRFGLSLAGLGLAALAFGAGWIPCLLAAATLALYLLAYTPMKSLTPHATWPGAAAGATAPLIGWAAATGGLTASAWTLFAIQFLWQIPHFLALFWMHREDYARAGFRVMPVVDPRGRLTACQIATHSFSLLPASLLPSLTGLAGNSYAAGALLVGGAYMGLGLRASLTLAPADTRRLFLASLAYLPTIFAMLWTLGA